MRKRKQGEGQQSSVIPT